MRCGVSKGDVAVVVYVVLGLLSHMPISSPITGLSIRLTAAVSSKSSAGYPLATPGPASVLPHTPEGQSLVSLAPV